MARVGDLLDQLAYQRTTEILEAAEMEKAGEKEGPSFDESLSDA